MRMWQGDELTNSLLSTRKMGLLSTLFVSTSYFSFFHLVDIDNYSIMHIQILKKSNKVEGTMHTMGLFSYMDYL